MRPWIYNTLLTLLTPWFFHKAKEQANHPNASPYLLKERFGYLSPNISKGGIWIHTVSVGESRSIYPLLTYLAKHFPHLPRLVTNGTVNAIDQVVTHAPVKVDHQMQPYDFPWSIGRFIKAYEPKLILIVETEIWPNLFIQAHKRGIPLALINARLKASSYESYQRWGQPLISQALQSTWWIACQYETDRERFISLGAKPEQISQVGNLKFDLQLPKNLKSQARSIRQFMQNPKRFIWVAASTHEGEEEKVLAAHRILLQQQPDALLILVPRSPQRFGQVKKLLTHQAWCFLSRSDAFENIDEQVQVILGDTMGELLTWYAFADVAFVGGSLVEFGGHNILEPAALAKPVLSGPHYQNLASLFDSVLAEEGLVVVNHEQALAAKLIQYAHDPDLRKLDGQKCLDAFLSQSGVLERLMQKITPVLSQSSH